MYDLQTFGSSRFIFKVKTGHPHLVLKTRHNDKTWKGRFFFVKRSSIPQCTDLPYEWITKGRTILVFLMMLIWHTLIFFALLQFQSLKSSYLQDLVLKKGFKTFCSYLKVIVLSNLNGQKLRGVPQIRICLQVVALFMSVIIYLYLSLLLVN